MLIQTKQGDILKEVSFSEEAVEFAEGNLYRDSDYIVRRDNLVVGVLTHHKLYDTWVVRGVRDDDSI